MKLDHTLTEAFKKFDLIAGVGSEESGEACAMTMLSWICGEEWSDHPPCAHRLIADIVVRANDAEDTTPTMRRQLVRAGRTGVLDTWWIPTEVVVAAVAGEDQTPFAVAMRTLVDISAWKKTKTRPNPSDANLTGANLAGANLTRANLTGANLAEANLAEANLAGACLAEACLTRANLTGVNLTGANLTGANLRGASLTGAYLTGANPRGANLTGANFRGAYLTGANLTGANLRGTYLTGAYGVPLSGMPNGWRLQNRLWMRA